MAPHTLLIDRDESTAPAAGGRVAWPRIKRVIAHQWEMGRLDLAWLCFCPPEAVRITRVGPVYLAHGGDWAYGRELESLRWKLLYPSPLSIRGKAVAVRPDRERPGCWRALSEWEAINAERVLRAHGLMLTQPASDRWQGLRQQLHGEWARRFPLGSPQEREELLMAFAEHQLQARQAVSAEARQRQSREPVAA
jgi:hypothetical protein